MVYLTYQIINAVLQMEQKNNKKKEKVVQLKKKGSMRWPSNRALRVAIISSLSSIATVIELKSKDFTLPAAVVPIRSHLWSPVTFRVLFPLLPLAQSSTKHYLIWFNKFRRFENGCLLHDSDGPSQPSPLNRLTTLAFYFVRLINETLVKMLDNCTWVAK